jgi:hypothetical protein
MDTSLVNGTSKQKENTNRMPGRNMKTNSKKITNQQFGKIRQNEI